MNKTDTLEADAPAAPQEPVAWQYRSRPAVNREWGEWHTVGYKPKGPECTRFMMRPLFAAPQPQQPRLTDEEILNIHALPCWVRMQFADKGYGIALDTATVVDFARAIEKKVRGEA